MRDKKRKLPEGWRCVTLGNIVEFLDHMRIPVNEQERKKRVGPYPYYGATGQVGWIDDYIFDEDLVLLAEDGGPFGSKTNPIAYKISGKSWVNNHAHVLRPRQGTDLNYVFYSLMLYDVTPYISGSTRGKLNQEIARSLPIFLPPTLDDQTRIANELERKMNEVEKMQQAAIRRKEAISAMQGAILREVFPYREGDKLSEGWRWEKLRDICFINPTKRKDFFREPNSQTSFVPMEAVDELTGRITKRITRPYWEISKGYTFFEEGDVLFAKITPCMQNGKSAIAQHLVDGVGFGSTEFHVLRPKSDVKKEWIYFFIRTAEFRKRAEEHFEGSAGQLRVPTDFIENSLIPLPPALDDQIRIATELERKMAEVEKMRQAADKELEAIEALPGAILREVFDFASS